MSQFQLIAIGIIMGIILLAVLLLSGVIPGFSLGGIQGGEATPLMMWGDFSGDILRKTIDDINEENRKSFSINYVEKSSELYEKELIDALASGKGPDIWLLSQDMILKHKDKVFLIPFGSFSERAFKDIFIEEGELYLAKGGIVAFPFLIDPIVLYWNRDLFAAAGISQPPKTWDELVDFSEKLTNRDTSGNILRSGTALGEFQNVDHAKEIISLLILQTGNLIVDPAPLRSTFVKGGSAEIQSSENAVRFFTEFSNPSKVSYSWNRALPFSKNAFVAGILAMYFGYTSEYKDIAFKNPHLNFDVNEIPQIKDGNVKATFAGIKALAVSKNSKNILQATNAIAKLTEKNAIAELAETTFMAPARRDLLAQAPQDPVLNVFYKSAIYSRAWLEPDSAEVSEMFRVLVDAVNTGKKKISEAVKDFHLKLNIMLANFENE